jgi:pimeloyl-ACP methyl ester carboxylesterase
MINGLSALLAAAALSSAAPPPAAMEVEAKGPQGALRGTMLPAAKGAPQVLIVPGSGPTDRDGNSPLGIRAGSYRLLAEGLAARGIGSVRIDKRGMFGSSGAVADANAVTVADYASDIRVWVETIRARTGAPCVWLLGHSEGGLMALAAAADAPEGVCGLILAAAPGRRLATVLREQLRANPANAPVLDQALAAIDRLERGERVDTAGLHPALAPLFAPPLQGFLISLFSQDPAALLARFKGPVLVMQGRRDLQVAAADAERLAAARPRVKLAMLDEVNHVLKRVPSGDRAANMASYADPNLPIAPEVVEAVAGFIAAHRPSP